MTTLKERLSAQMKTSMKSGDKETLLFVRNLHAAIRKKEIDDRVDLTDADVMKIVISSAKQRQDSIDQFKAGNREDLVQKEQAELAFLHTYLPAQMEESALRALIDSAVTEAKATTMKDLGSVMKILLPQVQGKAEGKWVNQLVRERIEKAV
jgi:uncharacterized protein YqeY